LKLLLPVWEFFALVDEIVVCFEVKLEFADQLGGVVGVTLAVDVHWDHGVVSRDPVFEGLDLITQLGTVIVDFMHLFVEFQIILRLLKVSKLLRRQITCKLFP
jgi:hypothetical protein